MSTLACMAADALARGVASMAERALPVIARQCDASVDLAATMLELARLGDLKLKPEHVCMSELIQAAFDEVMLGLPAGERPELHCAPMPALQADPRLLRPILVNLIGNAVKFSRHASRPRVEIDAAVHGLEISICVRDNGVGLAPEIAERIFAPFYRAHAEHFEGDGLGLSIVSSGGRSDAAERGNGRSVDLLLDQRRVLLRRLVL
jgi:signal transduction histidine kinase